MATTNNIDLIRQFVAQVERDWAAVEAERDWVPSSAPPPVQSHGRPILTWKPGNPPIPNNGLTIKELHHDLESRLWEYATKPMTADFPILLAQVPAGGGKTHSAVNVVQRAAEAGLRVLWAAPAHRLFEDLEQLQEAGKQIFNPELWWHFHSIQDEEWCREHKSQTAWLKRGYPALSLCQQICGFPENWIYKCPYRLQAKRKEPIVFGMHQHLTTGLSLGKFDLAIIDELPLAAFVKQRHIPADRLDIGATPRTALKDLTDIILYISQACEKGEKYSGRKLFDEIGEILQEVYRNTSIIPDSLPVIPEVRHIGEIDNQPYWYITELLTLAMREQKAWEMGWTKWAERVSVTSSGLHLLNRNEPWEHLPKRVIVLDATAEAGLYQRVFGSYGDVRTPAEIHLEAPTRPLEGPQPTRWYPRAFETYKPQIKRRGRIFQICGRLNGKSRVTKKDQLTTKGEELFKTAQKIAERYREKGRVCVVCHKAVRHIYETEFGPENVMHFGNLRGANSFKGCVCLIVCGTPGPNPQDVIAIATALDRERIEPFQCDDMRSLFIEQEYEYPISERVDPPEEGATPFRHVKGYWNEPELQAIQDQLSRAELGQAVHRSRLNSEPCDVWVLSAAPIGEPIDGIWEDPPIGPDGIPWQTWLKLEPWLNNQWQQGNLVGARQIALYLRGSELYIRQEKWLPIIQTFQPDRWDLTDDPDYNNKKGPRRQSLKPILF